MPLKDDGGYGDGVIVSDFGGREEARKAARLEGLKHSTGRAGSHDVPTPILDHERVPGDHKLSEICTHTLQKSAE